MIQIVFKRSVFRIALASSMVMILASCNLFGEKKKSPTPTPSPQTAPQASQNEKTDAEKALDAATARDTLEKEKAASASVVSLDCGSLNILSTVQNTCGSDFKVIPIEKDDIGGGSYTAEFRLGNEACSFSAYTDNFEKFGKLIVGIAKYSDVNASLAKVNAVIAEEQKEIDSTRTILEEFSLANGKGKIYKENHGKYSMVLAGIAAQGNFGVYIQPVGTKEIMDLKCSNEQDIKNLLQAVHQSLVTQ